MTAPMHAPGRARRAVGVALATLALCAVARAQTRWDALPPLPDAVGFAGGFAGVSGGALLFAGGANFPQPVWENDKAWHDRIFVLPEPSGAWREVGRLPRPLAYGCAVTFEDELVCIGGDDAERVHAEVFALRFDGAAVHRRALPALPRPAANAAAALVGSTVYVVGGQTGKALETATASGYRMDLAAAAPAWTPLPDLPGGARAFHFLVAQDDGRGTRIHLFGGRRHRAGAPSDLEPLRDTYDLDPASLAWRRRADAPVPLMAGTAVAAGQHHVLVLAHADGAVLREAATRGVAMRDFDHPGFPRVLYSYHAITDAWAVAGAIPQPAANQVTTTAVPWRGRIVVPSGEVRPRVRTPQVWGVELVPRAQAFGAANMAVLVAYLLGMVGVGVFFAARNKDTDDYFRGGQHVPWWAAGCSIYATMLSSLTYVALPALVFATDWLLYPGLFMVLGAAPIAVYLALPFYRRIDATSAYEYFGRRFNTPARLFSSGLFTLFHVSRMGIVMALTALALAAVTGLEPWQGVLVIGVLCVVYCTLGGIEAVIWTDTIQTVVLLGGALLCFLFVLGDIDGGLSGMVEVGSAHGKFRLFDADFGSGSFATLSLWVIVLGGLGQNVSSYTADQAVVQRYVTTRDERAAARSIWMNGVMVIPGTLLFFLLGTGLFVFYRAHPESLDPTVQNDQILPLFIGEHLPQGLAGLLVAGIFAAAQSTVSTSMNSTATTLVTDFLRPFGACRSERGYLRAARVLTSMMGLLGTAAGLLFISPEIRSLQAEYYKVIGMFMGALGGLFLLGATTRRATGWGALIGLLAGVAAMVSVNRFTRTDGYLYATVGIVTCWVVGFAASLLLPRGRVDLEGLTVFSRAARGPAPPP